MDTWMYQPQPPASASSNGSSVVNESGSSASATRRATGSPSAAQTTSLPAIRRRNRPIASCLECRRRKLKCDKKAPCASCTRFRRDCVYLDSNNTETLAGFKERMSALERTYERQAAKQGAASAAAIPPSPPANPVSDGEEAGEEVDELDAPKSSELDNMYGDDDDDDDLIDLGEFVDLGVQLGKMRISERIGGWIRPRVVAELNVTLVKASESESSSPVNALDRPAFAASGLRSHAPPKSYIGPSPDYVAPSSSILFGGTTANASLISFLPLRSTADMLIAQYFVAVHYLCRTVHRPTFEAAYISFWNHIEAGTEPAAARQAVVFAAMFSAAVSLDGEQALQQLGIPKASLISSLRSGTEYALSKANLLRTTKLETMQAFIMYLIPQTRGEVSRAHSALVGCAIRLAECLGLHRDGTHYKMSPVEVQVRRLLWQQLLFLDLRTCEATGPRLQIRSDDYDTQHPWNVDDSDLLDAHVIPTDKPYWTDATFARMRSEITEHRRQTWFDVLLLDKKKKKLTSMLFQVQKKRAEWTDRFFPMIDESVPFQALAKVVAQLQMHGFFNQILHRYRFSKDNIMPDRLRQLLIENGTCNLEHTIQIETRPELAPWAWYRGAFNQFHIALLLLNEVHVYPMRKEAPRIWKCLDYVFELPAGLPPKEKGELVLTDLRDRMEDYHQKRKLKSTKELSERYAPASGDQQEVGADLLSKQQVGSSIAGAQNLPVFFSPAPAFNRESSVSNSGQNSETYADDVHMIEDIDWPEWDTYFPLESNTGVLNVPDFDFADFTGPNTNSGPMAPVHFSSTTTEPQYATNLSAAELADISFTPTFYAAAVNKAGRQSHILNGRRYASGWNGP